MNDSCEILIETDNLQFYLEVEFVAIKGYISYDYFEPSIPDEIDIVSLKINDCYLSAKFCDSLINEYETFIMKKIEEYLNEDFLY